MRRVQVGDVLGNHEPVTIRSERVAQKGASRQNWCACSIW